MSRYNTRNRLSTRPEGEYEEEANGPVVPRRARTGLQREGPGGNSSVSLGEGGGFNETVDSTEVYGAPTVRSVVMSKDKEGHELVITEPVPQCLMAITVDCPIEGVGMALEAANFVDRQLKQAPQMAQSQPLLYLRQRLRLLKRDAVFLHVMDEEQFSVELVRGSLVLANCAKPREGGEALQHVAKFIVKVGIEAVERLATKSGVPIEKMDSILAGENNVAKQYLNDALQALESQEVSLLALFEKYGSVTKVIEAIEAMPDTAVVLKYLAEFLAKHAKTMTKATESVLYKVQAFVDDDPSTLIGRFMVYVRLLDTARPAPQKLGEYLLQVFKRAFPALSDDIEAVVTATAGVQRDAIASKVETYLQPRRRLGMKAGMMRLIGRLLSGRDDDESEEEYWERIPADSGESDDTLALILVSAAGIVAQKRWDEEAYKGTDLDTLRKPAPKPTKENGTETRSIGVEHLNRPCPMHPGGRHLMKDCLLLQGRRSADGGVTEGRAQILATLETRFRTKVRTELRAKLPLAVPTIVEQQQTGTAAVVQAGGATYQPTSRARNTSGTSEGPRPYQPRMGDWKCRVCQCYNYSNRTECYRRDCEGRRTDPEVEVVSRTPFGAGAGLVAAATTRPTLAPTNQYGAVQAPSGMYESLTAAATNRTVEAVVDTDRGGGPPAGVANIAVGGTRLSWADMADEEERKEAEALRTVYVASKSPPGGKGTLEVIEVEPYDEKVENDDQTEVDQGVTGDAQRFERLAHQHVPVGFEPKEGAVVTAPTPGGKKGPDNLVQTLDNLAGHVKALATGANRIEARMARLMSTMDRDEVLADALMALGDEMEEGKAEPDIVFNSASGHYINRTVEVKPGNGTAMMMQMRLRLDQWPPTYVKTGMDMPKRLMVLLDPLTDIQAVTYVNESFETGLSLVCGRRALLPCPDKGTGAVIQDDGASQVTISEAVARALDLDVVEASVRMIAAGGQEAPMAGVAWCNPHKQPLYVVRCRGTGKAVWTKVEAHVLRGNDITILIGGLESHLHNVKVDYDRQVVEYEPRYCATMGQDTSTHTMPMKSYTPGPKAVHEMALQERREARMAEHYAERELSRSDRC